MRNAEIELSIVIVSWNVKYFLEECIHSIYENIGDIDFEIIVVDNNSSDGSVSHIKEKFPKVLVIANKENRGFSIGNNQGVKASKGKFLLLLNPDTIIPEGMIAKLLIQLRRDERIGIIAPEQIGEDGRVVANFSCANPKLVISKATSFLGGPFRLRKRIEVLWLNAAIYLMRKSLYEQIDGFNEKLFLNGEEIEFCQKVRDAGKRIIYDRRFFIIHFRGKSFEQVDKKSGSNVRYFKNKTYVKSLANSIISQIRKKKVLSSLFWATILGGATSLLIFRELKRLGKKRRSR